MVSEVTVEALTETSIYSAMDSVSDRTKDLSYPFDNNAIEYENNNENIKDVSDSSSQSFSFVLQNNTNSSNIKKTHFNENEEEEESSESNSIEDNRMLVNPVQTLERFVLEPFQTQLTVIALPFKNQAEKELKIRAIHKELEKPLVANKKCFRVLSKFKDNNDVITKTPDGELISSKHHSIIFNNLKGPKGSYTATLKNMNTILQYTEYAIIIAPKSIKDKMFNLPKDIPFIYYNYSESMLQPVVDLDLEPRPPKKRKSTTSLTKDKDSKRKKIIKDYMKVYNKEEKTFSDDNLRQSGQIDNGKKTQVEESPENSSIRKDNNDISSAKNENDDDMNIECDTDMNICQNSINRHDDDDDDRSKFDQYDKKKKTLNENYSQANTLHETEQDMQMRSEYNNTKDMENEHKNLEHTEGNCKDTQLKHSEVSKSKKKDKKRKKLKLLHSTPNFS